MLVPRLPLIEQPEPLISFEHFLERINFFSQKGLLGFFNYIEVTEVFMSFDKKLPPLNVFSLIAFEEHDNPPASVEAAWSWKSRDSGVQAYYARMLYNTGLAQKAIIAVARKLAIILWRLVCEGRAYRPA